MQPSVQLGSDFFPRNRFYLARLDLTDAPLNFFCPCRFNVFVGFAVKTFEEATRELCPVGFRKLRCLTEKFCYGACHVRILPRLR